MDPEDPRYEEALRWALDRQYEDEAYLEAQYAAEWEALCE